MDPGENQQRDGGSGCRCLCQAARGGDGGPFGPRALPGLGLPAGCRAGAKLGRTSETSLWKYPAGWKVVEVPGRGGPWCARGRFLQGLRRAEDGAGGQKETAPASGIRSLEGGKEGRKTCPTTALRAMEPAPLLLLLSSLWGCSGECRGVRTILISYPPKLPALPAVAPRANTALGSCHTERRQPPRPTCVAVRRSPCSLPPGLGLLPRCQHSSDAGEG